jgi:FHA domain/von Willebrand factor type A domain
MRRALLILAVFLGGAQSAAAAPPPPAVVVLALDTSGSIAASDAERTRALAMALLGSLPAGSEVALLTFDDQSRIVVPRTASAEALKSALARIRTSGRYTALYDALYEASRYLRGAPATRKAVVLVTDGRDENSALNLDDGLGDARDSGIPFYTVGIGRVEERVLRRIAKLTGGEYTGIAQASATALASEILALPEPETTPEPAALTLATSAPVSAPPISRGRVALGLVLIGSVALAAILAFVALASRWSSSTPAPAPASSRDLGFEDTPDDTSSSTMLTRLDAAGEPLPRTVTLTQMPMLVVQDGPLAGQVFLLNAETTMSVGRARANDIVLDDVAVSSQHCRIRQEADHFVLHDLQSTNGTYVNERRVSRHLLKTGDVLRIGETQLRFRLDQKKA